MNTKLLLLLATIGIASNAYPIKYKSVIENNTWYKQSVETIARSEATGFDKNRNELIDIRGVGDTAWTKRTAKSYRANTPLRANFEWGLNKTDPEHEILAGDFSFINWESVIGNYCSTIRPSVQYYFLSHPDNIIQAHNFGFNLFSVSNNHSQDCNEGEGVTKKNLHGPLMTKNSMDYFEEVNDLLWHGAGDQKKSDLFQVKTKTFNIKGKKVKVAFGTFSILSWQILNSASINYKSKSSQARANKMIRSFQDVQADLKILAIHTQDSSGHNKNEGSALKLLKKVSEDFINKADGTIVYGQGPHTWAGVKVIEKDNGKRGVIFTSLGNFMHQGVRDHSENYLGRALVSFETMDVKEVQVLPLKNLRNGDRTKAYASFYSRKYNIKKMPNSNFKWQETFLDSGAKNIQTFYAHF